MEAAVFVPGRVNLIGEHIDYHDLPVLPIAIQRGISIAFGARNDSFVRAISSDAYGAREFGLASRLEPGPPGDWASYLKAAARAAQTRWKLTYGLDAAITSDLPAAAGLSSSSALLSAFMMALLEANQIRASFEDLMKLLPEAEHFVGTRGGGMDHAVILKGQPGCTLLIEFAPLRISPIAIPRSWRFLVAHSLTYAEKSGAALTAYNARRVAGTRALRQLGFESFRSSLDRHSVAELTDIANGLDTPELGAFLHVIGEAERVKDAETALRSNDPEAFGKLLTASYASLRDHLQVSSPALDTLVEGALDAGALGARVTGAGFGGCVLILCNSSNLDRIRERVVNRYYSQRGDFDPEQHLFVAEPSAGALNG